MPHPHTLLDRHITGNYGQNAYVYCLCEDRCGCHEGGNEELCRDCRPLTRAERMIARAEYEADRYDDRGDAGDY